jgi:DNA-binding HxlR family transcriptional regulator
MTAESRSGWPIRGGSISSNILAGRLKMLLDHGMITKVADPSHKQKAIYSLTEKSIALVPVFAQLRASGNATRR